MSRENVEFVRQVYDAASRHDAERIFDLYDADVELDASRLEAAWIREVYRGHEGLRAFFREWNEAWETSTTPTRSCSTRVDTWFRP